MRAGHNEIVSHPAANEALGACAPWTSPNHDPALAAATRLFRRSPEDSGSALAVPAASAPSQETTSWIQALVARSRAPTHVLQHRL